MPQYKFLADMNMFFFFPLYFQSNIVSVRIDRMLGTVLQIFWHMKDDAIAHSYVLKRPVHSDVICYVITGFVTT
jgi:hypothetical protein